MSKPLHIFRAGRHTAMSGAQLAFSEADLAATAAAYDPAKHEAPLVIGHPQHDSPAQGWVQSLAANGVDLHATPHQVNAEFAEQVRSGRIKKISAAFYPPDHPANPAPGQYYLRHVGFLGAQPPAIKGLQPVEFADDGAGLVEIEFSEGDDTSLLRRLLSGLETLLARTPASAATPAAAFADTPSDTPEHSMTDDEIKAEREKLEADRKALDARDAEFAEREKAINDAEARTARQEATEFAEKLEAKGQILPRHKNRVIELLHGLAPRSEVLEFAEGDQTIKATPAKALRDLLADMPNLVEYAEAAAAADDDAGGATRRQVPAGYSVNADRAAQHEKIVAYAEKHDVPYETAALKLGA